MGGSDGGGAENVPESDAGLEWNLSNIGPLPPPWPPLMDWLREHGPRLRCDDIETLTMWFNITAHFMRIERTRAKRRVYPKNAVLLRRLAKVRAATKALADNLPELIKAAEIDLTREILLRDRTDSEKWLHREILLARQANNEALELERSILALIKKMENGLGFYGSALEGKRPEPWARATNMLFAWLSHCLKEAGMIVPQKETVSERTPLVKVIREALRWMGYGERELSTIAKSIKRDYAAKIPPQVNGNALRSVMTEMALMETPQK